MKTPIGLLTFVRKSDCFVLCLALLLMTGRITAQPSAGKLLAGVSESNITPFLDELIVGNFTKPAAKYIHDELYAKSHVLDDGQNQLAIVIIDNIMASAEVYESAKSLIEMHTNIKKEDVLIAATHTHSSISARGENFSGYAANRELDEYQRFLARRISDGVRRAIYNKQPARIAHGSVQVPQHVFNRRWFLKPGTDMTNPFGEQDKVRFNPGVGNPNLDKPAGPTDPEVSFISVQTQDGKPLALLANYSLHYVGGVPVGEISADYYGVFASYFKDLLGGEKGAPGFVAMMSNGTSGDVNNINVKAAPEKRAPYEKMGIVARDVADAIFEKYKTLEYKTDVKLAASVENLQLGVRKPTSKQLARAREVVANPDGVKLYHPLESHYAKSVILQEEEWPDKISVVIQAIRIGDMALTAIPFEVFAETGLELK